MNKQVNVLWSHNSRLTYLAILTKLVESVNNTLRELLIIALLILIYCKEHSKP